MDWTSHLTNLRNILAKLYETEADTRIVIHDVGLESYRINLEGSARNRWHSVLTYAIKHNRVNELLQTAQIDFPANPELAEVAENYYQSVQVGPSRERKFQPSFQKLEPAIEGISPGKSTAKELQTILEESPQRKKIPDGQMLIAYPKTGIEFHTFLFRRSKEPLITKISVRAPYKHNIFSCLSLGMDKSKACQLCQQLFDSNGIEINQNTYQYPFPSCETNIIVQITFQFGRLSQVQLFWHPNPQVNYIR